jgi:N-methylhydantoinase A/oxoprolinase/acetone carboxylase beta subunit
VASEPISAPAPRAVRKTVFGKSLLSTPLFHRDDLSAGMHGSGPAIIVSGQSTNVISPAFAWRIDAEGTLIATRTNQKRGRHAH